MSHKNLFIYLLGFINHLFVRYHKASLHLLLLLILIQSSLTGQITLTSSDLPLFVLDTDTAIIVDEPKITAHLGVIYNGEGHRNNVTDSYNHYDGLVGIEFRGATSQTLFEKKGYAMETRLADGSNNNVELLGLPKENDWVLHGPYSDKTLMRNALAYHIAGELMAWAPRTRFVEVILNGDYQGVYVLTEKIKVVKNRVDVTKQDEDESDVSGGYILKLDKTEGAINAGYTSEYPAITNGWQQSFYQYHFPKPKDITTSQMDYVSELISSIDETFMADDYADPIDGYRRHLDEASMMDFFIVNELSKNVDGYRLSTFMHKDRDEVNDKLVFGPVWDFNLGFGNVDYCTGGSASGFVAKEFNRVCSNDFWVINFWWEKVLSDTLFTQGLGERWSDLREGVLSEVRLHEVVDSFALVLAESQIRNFQKYSVLGQYIWPNYRVQNSYEGEVEWLKEWLSERLAWMDDNIPKLSDPPFDPRFTYDPEAIPNPVVSSAVLRYYSSAISEVWYTIVDAQGRLIKHERVRDQSNGFNEIAIPSDLNEGIYYFVLTIDGKKHTGSFVRL